MHRLLLKSHTAPAHTRLDSIFFENRVTENPQCYQIFLHTMERSLAAHAHSLRQAALLCQISYLVPEQLELLKADQEGLCQSFPNLEPLPRDSLGIESSESLKPSSILAIAYVFEGSAMGARALLKLMSKRGSRAPFPCRFLKNQVQHSTDRWPLFLNTLNNHTQMPAEALESASKVFAQMELIAKPHLNLNWNETHA